MYAQEKKEPRSAQRRGVLVYLGRFNRSSLKQLDLDILKLNLHRKPLVDLEGNHTAREDGFGTFVCQVGGDVSVNAVDDVVAFDLDQQE